MLSKARGFQKHGAFKSTGLSKARGFQKHGAFKSTGPAWPSPAAWTTSAIALACRPFTRSGRSRKDARRPVSRVLSARSPKRSHGTTIPLGRASQRASRDQPGRRDGNVPAPCLLQHARPPLFGLAPGGVYPAASVTGGAVRSYRTVSPLPVGCFHPAGGLFSVALSLGSPPPAVNRHRIPVEPGLSSIPRTSRETAAVRPSGGGDMGPGGWMRQGAGDG
jgi:hypothetical protein